jgi:alanine racemase
MTGTWQGEEDAMVQYRLTPAVWMKEHIKRLERAARAVHAPEKFAVHLKVDTGMGRLGVPLSELKGTASRIVVSRYLTLEGVYSHLASTEIQDPEHTDLQIERFQQAVGILRSAGIEPRYLHIANSAAIVGCPHTWNNMVRAGLLLYGYNRLFTAEGVIQVKNALKPATVGPVLTWKSRVVSLRKFSAGQAIGYDCTHVTRKASRIAVIPVGYGDGFFRAISNRARVIVRDHYAPVVGNISMDLTTIDVSAVPSVEVGDEVLLIGSSPQCRVTADDHARWAGTIPYEVLCRIAPRVPRIYGE